MVMGLQHTFAIVGGLITPPYMMFCFTIDLLNMELQQYAIMVALITSRISNIIDVLHWEIPLSKKLLGKWLYIGSGLLSIMGMSFTFLPIFKIAIHQMMVDGVDGMEAYSKMIGMNMACVILEVIFFILPGRIINKMFLLMVCTVTVMLINVVLRYSFCHLSAIKLSVTSEI